jgi:hypothetical protein
MNSLSGLSFPLKYYFYTVRVIIPDHIQNTLETIYSAACFLPAPPECTTGKGKK